ncbi:MAG: hypothetical protein RLZZ350_1918 [Verrucomicrobiota bacterium]|jgi:hypothetical protein
MRLWTIHPQHLDAKGLVALWREGLLAQKVLQGRTRGYKHHPQLFRFAQTDEPVAAIASYLVEVHAESVRRGYNFAASKIDAARFTGKISETRGQLGYEWEHLQRKLKLRDPARYAASLKISEPAAHPLFRLVSGAVRDWEVVG